ncbi:hypothetical protein JCM33374_g4616 [Metschnikowia sp. JCM 33374]|nr:hypothetical protein JCM33374_g4616 [Metschnikowia sp. JCM 33374]
MTDLTPIFSQCVRIVSHELKSDIKPVSDPNPRPFVVSDTFSTECMEVYTNLNKLATFVVEVRPLYLQINDEFSQFDHGPKRELSQADKQNIDEDFKLKVQHVYEKLKYLQAYERKRGQLWESQAAKSHGLMSSIFTAAEDDPSEIYYKTLATHRMHILRFLSDTTSSVNKEFESMQRQRYGRERQLKLLHISNLDDADDADFALEDFNNNSTYQFEVTDEHPQHESQSTSQLTQEQIQELSSENKELLNMKTNQFKQVEKLHHSMVDIVKLQTELTMHLETQAEQIESLLDNQDQIDVDLRMGNRNLSKATDRNKRGSNLIVTTCIVLGFLLLFVDYIS